VFTDEWPKSLCASHSGFHVFLHVQWLRVWLNQLSLCALFFGNGQLKSNPKSASMHPKKHPFAPLNHLVSSERTINQTEHRQPCTKAVTPAFWCTGAMSSHAVDAIHHFPMFSCMAWVGSRHPSDQLLPLSLQCELCPNNMVLLHQHCAIEQCYQSKSMLFGTSWCTLLLGGHCLIHPWIGWWLGLGDEHFINALACLLLRASLGLTNWRKCHVLTWN